MGIDAIANVKIAETLYQLFVVIEIIINDQNKKFVLRGGSVNKHFSLVVEFKSETEHTQIPFRVIGGGSIKVDQDTYNTAYIFGESGSYGKVPEEILHTFFDEIKKELEVEEVVFKDEIIY